MAEHLSGHPKCERAGTHICAKPVTSAPCIEIGCDREPGTDWGPLWCPDHDSERMARISASLEAIASAEGDQR